MLKLKLMKEMVCPAFFGTTPTNGRKRMTDSWTLTLYRVNVKKDKTLYKLMALEFIESPGPLSGTPKSYKFP